MTDLIVKLAVEVFRASGAQSDERLLELVSHYAKSYASVDAGACYALALAEIRGSGVKQIEISNDVGRCSVTFIDGNAVVRFLLDGEFLAQSTWTAESGFAMIPGRFAHLADQLDALAMRSKKGLRGIVECRRYSDTKRREAALGVLRGNASAQSQGRRPPYDFSTVAAILDVLRTIGVAI